MSCVCSFGVGRVTILTTLTQDIYLPFGWPSPASPPRIRHTLLPNSKKINSLHCKWSRRIFCMHMVIFRPFSIFCCCWVYSRLIMRSDDQAHPYLPIFLILELIWSGVSTLQSPHPRGVQLLFRPCDIWTSVFSHLKVYSSIRWHIKHIDQWLHFENQARSKHHFVHYITHPFKPFWCSVAFAGLV